MAKPTANLRLFVAIHPPVDSAQAMLESLHNLSDLPSHKPTALEQVHLTLQFIGDRPVKDLDETIESVQRALAGLAAFELAPQRLITLPERGPARLIACETDAPATLMELQRRLAHRLAKNPREAADQRFRPHLTLCRFRSPARHVRIDMPVEMRAFAVSAIRLMRSTLDPSGAQHHEVVSVALNG
jgi:RNA 2',3'-cyclic 3'-phosphodiesterase